MRPRRSARCFVLSVVATGVFLAALLSSVVPALAADWTGATMPPEMYAAQPSDSGYATGEFEVVRGAERVIEDSAGNLWAYVRNEAFAATRDAAIFLLRSGASEWVRFDQGLEDAYPNEDWYLEDMVALGDEVYLSVSTGVFARRATEPAWRQLAPFNDPWVDDLEVFDGFIWGSETSGVFRYDPRDGAWEAANQGLPAEAHIGGVWPFHCDFSANSAFLYVGLWDASSGATGPRDPTFSKTGVYRWRLGGSSWEHVGLSIDPRDYGMTEAGLTSPDTTFWGSSWLVAVDGHVLCQQWVHGGGIADGWHDWQVFDETAGGWTQAGAIPREYGADDRPFLEVGRELVVVPEGRIVYASHWGAETEPGVTSVYEFDPAGNSWNPVSLPVVRWPGGLGVMLPAIVGGSVVLEAGSVVMTTAPSPEPDQLSFVPSVPLPTEISKDPEVIGTNFILALVFAAIFGFTSTLFNNTLKSKNAEIVAALGPVTRRMKTGAKRATAFLRRLGGRLRAVIPQPAWLGRLTGRFPHVRRRWIEPVSIVLVTGLIYAFLDPGFGVSTTGLVIFVSLAVSVAVVTYAYEGLQALASSRGYHIPARLKLFPAAIMIAVICVIVSRASGFSPGYLYGFVGGLAFLGAREPDDRRKGRLVLIAAGSLLVVSLATWFLAVPLTNAIEAGSSSLKVLQGICVATFVAGLEGLVFGLIPLSFMDGATLFRWNKWVWGATFGVAVFLFWHVLLNKDSKYGAAFQETSAKVVVGLLAFWTVVSLGTYLYFRKPWKKLAPEPVAAVAVQTAEHVRQMPASSVEPASQTAPALSTAPTAHSADVAAATKPSSQTAAQVVGHEGSERDGPPAAPTTEESELRALRQGLGRSDPGRG